MAPFPQRARAAAASLLASALATAAAPAAPVPAQWASRSSDSVSRNAAPNPAPFAPAIETAFGIRWKLIVDEVHDYLAPCERLGRARGLAPADFDRVFPYRDIKRCNILERDSGAPRITHEGEPGFTLTGANGNVFVEIPKHYAMRRQAQGYEYRYVSDRPHDGFTVDPAFVECGRELDHVYVGAYEAHIRDGRMESVTGVCPTTDRTRPEYRRSARANGVGYGILDIRMLNMLQNLYLIEYADRDSQSAVGRGWGKILQPASNALRCIRAERGTNRIVVNDWNPTFARRLFIGSAIQIVDRDSHTVRLTGRTLTQVHPDTPSPGLTAVCFDGPPIDTDLRMVLGGAAQKTGWTDALASPSGRTAGNGSGPDADYRAAVRYRYMENLWGNAWHFIDGLNLERGVAYVSDCMTQYESGASGGAYRAVPTPLAVQTDNATVGGDREIHYMKNLSFDPLDPFLALPKDYVNRGLRSVPHAQSAPRLGSDTLRHAHFGDYYYLNTTAHCYVHGGGFDHYWRGGLFTLRGWATDTRAWYLYGARMIYRPIHP